MKYKVTTNTAASKANYYRGMVFRVMLFKKQPIFEGYDCGSRVVYALSEKEFKSKADAWIDKGVTTQYAPRAVAKRRRA